MKKLILALLVAGTAATANAQEPRSILLYGTAGLDQTREQTQVKNTMWHVSPGVGYQFNHNWTVGLNLSWGQNATKDASASKTTDNMYGAGAFARYSEYIRRSEIFFWYAQFDFSYVGGYTTNDGNPATQKYNGVGTQLFPALGINVGRGLALNFSVGGINYTTTKMDGAAYSKNVLGVSFGQQVNFGLSKNFNVAHKMHAHHEPGEEVHHRRIDNMDDEDDDAPKPKRKQRSRDEDE